MSSIIIYGGLSNCSTFTTGSTTLYQSKCLFDDIWHYSNSIDKHSYQTEAKSIMLGLREAKANLILSSPAAADTKWGN